MSGSTKGSSLYRRRFVDAYGDGPWPCHFCSGEVRSMSRRGASSGCIHHIDGDHYNNAANNLAAAHNGCHTRHHVTGLRRTLSEEARINIGKASTGRRYPNRRRPPAATAEERANKSAGAYRGWETRRQRATQ